MAMQSSRQAWARGGLVFAATLMLIIGVYQIFLGIAAIARNAFFVVGANYAYQVDTSVWGWIHLAVGVLVAAAGFFLFTGLTLAKIVGIGLISLSAIANFFFLPYYPVWSLLIIALDVFAIWAIANVRIDSGADELAERSMGATAGYAGSAPGSGAGYGDATQGGQRWPAENEASGRHLAPDNVKEGQPTGTGYAGSGTSETAEAARERASAAGRSGMGGNQPNQPNG
jgi:hypothetical protein